MKQATGELNATVVVFLAVGVLIAFFYYTLWPAIRQGFIQSSRCSSAICESCPKDDKNCDFVDCHAKNDASITFRCVNKG